MPRVEVIGRSDEAGRPLIQDVSEAELAARPDLYRPLATGPVLAQGAGGELFATTREGLAQDVTGARGADTGALAAEAARRGDEAVYGTLGQQALTGVEGLADSATLGLYTTSRLAGTRPDDQTAEDIRGRARVNPGIRAGTKLAGDVGLTLLSGGAGGAAKVAGLTGPGAIGRVSSKVTERAAQRGVGAQLLAGTATGAAEGAIAALGDTLAESALADAPLSGEALLANMGKNALLGSVAGGVAETVSVGGRKLLSQLERTSSADDLARVVETIDDTVVEQGGEAIADAATGTVETRATRLVTPEQLETERMSAAGRVVQAVEQSAGGLRQAKAQIRQVVTQIPPDQAIQVQAAFEAHQKAVVAARRASRDAARAVAAGKNPPDGALEVLASVDSTRASLDDAIGKSFDAAGLPRPEPVMPPLKPKAAPAQPEAVPPPVETPAAAAAPEPTVTPEPEIPAAAAAPPAPEPMPAPAPEPVKAPYEPQRTKLPPGFEHGALGTRAPVYDGLPPYERIDAESIYVVNAREIADRVKDAMGGAGVQAQRQTKIRQGWEQGKAFHPIQLIQRKDGTFEFIDGRHRFLEAVEQDRPIAVRLDYHIADDVAEEAAEEAVDEADDVLRTIELDGVVYEEIPGSGWFSTVDGVRAEGKLAAQINEKSVDELLAREVSASMPPDALRRDLEEANLAHRSIKSAVDYAAGKVESGTLAGQVLASHRRHAVAVAEALEAIDGGADDLAAALREVQESRRILREDLAGARGKGGVSGTLRDDQAREIVAQWRRSRVEDGKRVDPQTGEVLEGKQWEAFAKSMAPFERSSSLTAEALDSYANANAKRAFADVREAFERQVGGDYREVMLPRNTSAFSKTLLSSEETARISAEYARRFQRGDKAISLRDTKALDDDALSRRAAEAEEFQRARRAEYEAEQAAEAAKAAQAKQAGEASPKASSAVADAPPAQAKQPEPKAADPEPAKPAPAERPATTEAPAETAAQRSPTAPAAATAPAEATAPKAAGAPEQRANPADAVSLPDAPEAKATGARALAERVADVAGYLELAQTVGIPGLPDVDSIPVIGPVLGAYLKARAILGGGRLGKVIGTKGTVRAAENVVKVRAVIDKAVRGLAKGMANPMTKAVIKSGIKVTGKVIDAELTKEEMEQVRQLAEDPERIAARIQRRLAGAPQSVIDATTDAAVRKAKWLASKAPRPALADTPFAPEWSPSPVQTRDWQIRTGVVDAPQDAISGLLSGRYNAVAVDALRNVYPELYADVQRQLLARIDDIVQRVPRPLRLNIGKAFDLPLDSTQVPWYAAAMATAGQDQQQQEQTAAPPQSAAVVPRYTSTLATGPEARAMRGR